MKLKFILLISLLFTFSACSSQEEISNQSSDNFEDYVKFNAQMMCEILNMQAGDDPQELEEKFEKIALDNGFTMQEIKELEKQYKDRSDEFTSLLETEVKKTCPNEVNALLSE